MALGQPPKFTQFGSEACSLGCIWGTKSPASQTVPWALPADRHPQSALPQIQPFSGPSEPPWTWEGTQRPGQHLPSQMGKLRAMAGRHRAGSTPGPTVSLREAQSHAGDKVKGAQSYLSLRLSMKRLVKALTLSTRAP